MTALTISGVTKAYGATPVLLGVDLHVPERTLTAVLGPSGCGKTTLLRLVAGFDAPDSGTITLGGTPVAGAGRTVPPQRRRVGYVPQEGALFPHLSVAANVTFGLPRRSRAAAGEFLELVGLDPALADRHPHELSGGQQQRVALARALAPRPSVVLFDEAFGNLDHGLRSSVRDATAAALRGSGAAGVFVTHDQGEALAVGERVCVMREGRFEHVGEPADAFHRPATRYVATLLGEADFVPGRQSGAVVTTEVGALEATPLVSGDVEVMLRPHEVVFAPDPAGTARVVRREFRGATYLYTLGLPSGALVRALVPHTLDVAPGTAVTVGVEAGHPVRSFARQPFAQ